MYTWQTLPTHILENITNHLPRSPLLSFSKTCKQWYKVWDLCNLAWEKIVRSEFPRYIAHTENPASTDFRYIFRELKIMYENFHHRTHWLVHAFIDRRRKTSDGYIPFRDVGYVATGFEPGGVGKHFVQGNVDEKFFMKHVEEHYPPTAIQQIKAFYLTMKLGDICVMRNIYNGSQEFVIGEVISDVIWKDEGFHKVIGMGEMGVRLVHWHYVDVPYGKLSKNEHKLVPYLCGQLTISRIGEKEEFKHGKKEMWDVARKHGTEATTRWFFDNSNIREPPTAEHSKQKRKRKEIKEKGKDNKKKEKGNKGDKKETKEIKEKGKDSEKKGRGKKSRREEKEKETERIWEGSRKKETISYFDEDYGDFIEIEIDNDDFNYNNNYNNYNNNYNNNYRKT